MDNLTRNVSAVVDYDYSANEPDELDLVKGAIIHNIKIQPGGWWEGTLASNGRTGMFPDNFVHIIDPDEKSPVVLRDKSATAHRRCKVIYSYTQQNEDELSLAVGNIIEVLGEVEEGWWRGKLGEKVGVFPSNFVEALPASPVLANKRPNSTKKENRSLHSSREDLLSTSPSLNIIDNKDAPVLPPKPVREYCRVLYPYEPQNEDELELQVGDVITVVSKELPDKGWWRGEIRGKIGVFPDNFVKLIPPEVSPSKEPHITDKPPAAATSSAKVFVKKSGSGSSSQGSTRKDSFGSRDSLNDILNETGIVSGNVAAQRKSLENKNLDLTSGMAGGDGKLRRSIETKPTEIRKSLDIPDDKKTPPPVLSKKPVVPVKKSTSVTSVAGSLLSGLKQKVKSVEHKVTAHDSLDGIGSSKSTSQIADNNERGIIGEKLKKGDLDFDHVERDSLLTDMRANRVKAPRRRPPSAAINAIGESNNNDSTYLNGSGTYSDVMQSESRADSLEEELVKPKPREWGKMKAPWMEELKASQAKKTSPSVEPRAGDRLSKMDADSLTKTSSEKSEMTRSITNSYSSSSSSVTATQRKVENASSLLSSMLSSSTEMKSTAIETNSKRELNDTSKLMSSSLIATTKSPNAAIESSTATTAPSAGSLLDDMKSRPTSLSILNRSVSPISSRTATTATTISGKTMTTSTATIYSSVTTATTDNSVKPPNSIAPVNEENVCERVMELDERIQKLESIVQAQNKIIDELVRSLKEETDKVKGLKTELDKYAQCVTQV